MLKAKDIMRRNGEPLLVELTEVAENKRFPAWQFGLKIELPEAIAEELRAAARQETVEAARRVGLDEETIQEHVGAHFDDIPVECLAEEPFSICWN